MKEKSKWKWKRMAQKKWLFPAMYLFLAVFLISGVYWYQNSTKQVPEVQQESVENKEQPASNDPTEQAAEPVMEPSEIIQMPVNKTEKLEIVTKFFDYNASAEEQQNSLIQYNNRFYQSVGIDITVPEQETFDVVASLSGTVEEVKEDPLMGNVVVLAHDQGVKTYYASLGDVSVKTGDQLKQGNKLGNAGENLFGKDNGTHLHFEIRKDDQKLNPEAFFNQSVSKLEEATFTDDDERDDERDDKHRDEDDRDDEPEDDQDEYNDEQDDNDEDRDDSEDSSATS